MAKNIVITGANRGIGLALATVFRLQGDTVYALCRNSSQELDKLDVKIVPNVDVASEVGLQEMQAALSEVGIDVLICNAGILRDENLTKFNSDTIREQFEVNALAPLRLVQLLQNQLNDSSKIAMITSRMGSIADNGSGGRYGYRMSKAALNAASMSLAKDLAPRNIAVGIYHPGYVQTDMVNHSGDISTQECSQRLLGLINNLTMNETGVFKHSNGQVLPW